MVRGTVDHFDVKGNFGIIFDMFVTQLYFRYSPIYDKTLATLTGSHLTRSQIKEGLIFADTFSKYWQNKNDKIFKYYKKIGFVLPNFWLAYPVHSQKRKTFVPFSDPLTIFISKDSDAVAATMIHELCHTFFGYFENVKRAEELWSIIVKKFPLESVDVQEHILVNVLAAGGYFVVFEEKQAIRLILREHKYPSLKRSWDIIFKYISAPLKLKDSLRVLDQFKMRKK